MQNRDKKAEAIVRETQRRNRQARGVAGRTQARLLQIDGKPCVRIDGANFDYYALKGVNSHLMRGPDSQGRYHFPLPTNYSSGSMELRPESDGSFSIFDPERGLVGTAPFLGQGLLSIEAYSLALPSHTQKP